MARLPCTISGNRSQGTVPILAARTTLPCPRSSSLCATGRARNWKLSAPASPSDGPQVNPTAEAVLPRFPQSFRPDFEAANSHESQYDVVRRYFAVEKVTADKDIVADSSPQQFVDILVRSRPRLYDVVPSGLKNATSKRVTNYPGQRSVEIVQKLVRDEFIGSSPKFGGGANVKPRSGDGM